MADQQHENSQSWETETPLGNLRFGIKVLGRELKKLLMKALRWHETRQIERLLDTEYTALGKAVADRLLEEKGQDDKVAPGLNLPQDELEMALKQITFLRDELAHQQGQADA